MIERNKMINYVTGYEYTGKNAEILMCLDVEKSVDIQTSD